MLEAFKAYLSTFSKNFSSFACICLILYSFVGVLLVAIAVSLNASENWSQNFFCLVGNTTLSYKKAAELACFTRYGQIYYAHLPFYAFVLLSIGLSLLVSVVYSLMVRRSVEEIEKRSLYIKQETEDSEYRFYGSQGVYVCYSYFLHLVLRSLLGIIFTVLQHTYFYPNGFESKFRCDVQGFHTNCYSRHASNFRTNNIGVTLVNVIATFVTVAEIIYLCPRLPIFCHRSTVGWNSDTHFVTTYLLANELELQAERRRKYVCTTAALSNVVELHDPLNDISTSDWSVIR